MRHLVSLALSLAFAAPSWAQLGGTITGRVVDALGDPVYSAGVTIKPQAGGIAVTANTGRDGNYSVSGLAEGGYDVSTNVTAMTPFTKKDVQVKRGEVVRLDIKLQENTQLGTLGEDRVTLTADLARHAAPKGPAPRTADGKPDLSGVWWRLAVTESGSPQFLPQAEAIAKARRDSNSKDSPQARCLPGALLRVGPLWQIVQSPAGLVVISDDDSPGFYQIYTDGRKHPADPNPAWRGHNVGHWEGDTLVVDRVGFHDDVWLDQDSHPHSAKLHMIDRYRRVDAGHIEVETTVEDPGVLAKPFTMKRSGELAPGEEILEFVCPENNQDPVHMVGK